MAPAMEGGGSKSPSEIRKLTLRQARYTVMGSKEALREVSGIQSGAIKDFVDQNKKNWMPISELKKMTKEQIIQRNRELENG